MVYPSLVQGAAIHIYICLLSYTSWTYPDILPNRDDMSETRRVLWGTTLPNTITIAPTNYGQYDLTLTYNDQTVKLFFSSCNCAFLPRIDSESFADVVYDP